MTMLAYHNNPALRDRYIARARREREAGNQVQARSDWTKATIGCSSRANTKRYKALERKAGIPVILNVLADAIFEGLPAPDYKAWPERYVSAPRAGADLSKTHRRFLAWLIGEALPTVLPPDAWALAERVCRPVAALHERSARREYTTVQEWDAAAVAAGCVAHAACVSSTRTAHRTMTASSVWFAAHIASASADGEVAARCAACTDKALRRARSLETVVRWAAPTIAWSVMADKLVSMMSEA